MTRRVEGVYPTVDDALRAVDRLTDEGYSRDNIILVANEDVRNTFTANLNIEGMHEARLTKTEEDKSLWDSIKDLFTSDDFYDDPNYDVDNNPLFAHREKIKSGEVGDMNSAPLYIKKPQAERELEQRLAMKNENRL